MVTPSLMILFLIISLALSILSTRGMIGLSRRLGLLGEDVHKPDRPTIPKMGGVGFVSTFLALTTVAGLLTSSPRLLGMAAAVTIAALIGLLEDLKEINPLMKPVLLLLPGLPILLLGLYDPRPALPFIGGIRLTIIYPILVFVAYSVVTNAVNSMDVLNGTLVLTSIPPLTLIALFSYISGYGDVNLSSLIILGALLGFLRYNIFPAKTFSGNVGSMTVGAAIASMAILAKLEFLTLIALIPHIMNEFYLLASVGGIRSGKVIPVRPVKVKDGLISANPHPRAPLTLVRMITASRSMGEKDVALHMFIISSYAALLAVLTYLIDSVF